MKMYEYKMEHIIFENNTLQDSEKEKEILLKLNSFGREGWELCAADKNRFYLKKEI